MLKYDMGAYLIDFSKLALVRVCIVCCLNYTFLVCILSAVYKPEDYLPGEDRVVLNELCQKMGLGFNSIG